MKSTVKKKTLMKDMTQGSPVKLILEFTLPMIFGFLFQQFYNMADTVIVGRFLGVKVSLDSAWGYAMDLRYRLHRSSAQKMSGGFANRLETGQL